ncbi:MAG: acyl-CoA dehydrogenase family protein [Deltaproteobacteria bacterium]|nr:acyl-CoA dehydrogenase family protein [Deltaproteobacteria bacterium]
MIDKSTASFAQSMCLGEIEEDILLPYPTIKEAEKETLRATFESFDALFKPHEKDFAKWDKDAHLPPEFIDELKQFGGFGLVIPEAFGGIGLGSAAYSRAVQEVAKYDGSVAVSLGAHSSIGMRGLLLFGTDEQKKRYLPKLATGELIAAFCLTEAGAGSDAAAIKTRAVREGGDWILNGEKIWITNGGFANFFTVFAKTPGEGGKAHMTAFLVTRDMGGLTNGPHEDKMGIRASSTTTIVLDNVRVPAANMLGQPGQGFKIAMKILNSGRTGLGGGSVGAMKRVIGLAANQAKDRHQFGQPIMNFGLVKQKLGHMVVDCYVTESTVNMLAGIIDQGYEDYAVEAAISKVFASECLWRVADQALQIAGGNGYMREFPYERILRDCRINRIFEGTNDILRLFIALTGMKGVGEQLKELTSSLRGVFDDPIKGFGVLSDYALKHASFYTPLERPKSRFTRLAPEINEQAVIFEEGVRKLAAAADRVLRKHGKRIVEKQFATRRLSDIMIDLYTLACTLARVDQAVKEKGAAKCSRELAVLEIFGRQAKGRVSRNFNRIDDNDDEVIKALADHVCEVGRYDWDNI